MDQANSSSFAYNHPRNMVSLFWCGLLLNEPAVTNLNRIPITVKTALQNIYQNTADYKNNISTEKRNDSLRKT